MASEIDLNALMSSLSFWESAGYVSVAAVGIGVAGEFVHDFVPSLRIYRWWGLWGGKVSGLVLIAALAAELITQVKANSMSGQIIAAVSDRTAAANLEVARLRSPRLLNPTQQEQFVAAMQPFTLQQVSFGAIPRTFEASAFGEQLIALLRRAGVDAHFNQAPAEAWMGPVRGLLAKCMFDDERSKAFATAFSSILSKYGIIANPILGNYLTKPPSINKDDIYFSWVVITVGDKI